MHYKILHLIDTTGPGGAEDVFISLASRLNIDGIESIAVIRGEGYVADSLRKKGITPIIIDSKGSFNIQFLRKMVSLIRQHKVGLIQSHLLGSNVYASILGLLTRTPVVGTYHGMVDVSPNERFRKAKLWFMRKGIGHFVTVSHSLKEEIMRRNLLVPSRTSVIYNGIDTQLYCGPKSTRLRNAHAIPRDHVVYGALGNIRKAKRYDLLIEAAARLKSKGIPVTFLIAGDPKKHLKDELDALITKYQLDNIHFIGFVTDTPEYLRNLDGFILTSDSEGFSISTIEAMATGLPLISTKCGGPEEIIASEEQGALVDLDPEAIADAVQEQVQRFNRDHEFPNEAGQERVRNCFSEDVMLQNYKQIYSSLTDKFPTIRQETT